MRNQKLYGVMFSFENFNYDFGRNVLSAIVRNTFPDVMRHSSNYVPSDKDTIEDFKKMYPEINMIQLRHVKRDDRDLEPDGIRNYVITKLWRL